MKSIGFIGKIAMYAMMVISVVLCVLMVANDGEDSSVSTAIIWSYITLGLCLVAAVLSAVIGAFTNSGGLLKTIIVIVACAALVLICWSLSDSTPLNIIGYEGDENCEPWLNIADTGLFLFYAIGLAAVLAIVYSEVIKFFK